MATYRTLCNRCERYARIGQAYRRWYAVSRAVIRRLVDYHTNRPTDDPLAAFGKRHDSVTAYQTLCDLVAITSPRVSVTRNLWFAWGEFTGEDRPRDMIRSTRVALDHYYETGIIRGPKTSRFAQVLRGDDSVVVVDTWMARALSVPDNQARNKSTQELAERVVKAVRMRVWPKTYPIGCGLWELAETQAAIWAGMIRTHYDKGKVPIMWTDYVGLYRTGENGRLTDVPF